MLSGINSVRAKLVILPHKLSHAHLHRNFRSVEEAG